jgi:hypothetical protein
MLNVLDLIKFTIQYKISFLKLFLLVGWYVQISSWLLIEFFCYNKQFEISTIGVLASRIKRDIILQTKVWGASKDTQWSKT